MADEIKCVRCGQKRDALGYAPYPNELGQRIGAEVCQQCWREWLQKQQMIINHYGLNLMEADAQTFLLDGAAVASVEIELVGALQGNHQRVDQKRGQENGREAAREDPSPGAGVPAGRDRERHAQRSRRSQGDQMLGGEQVAPGGQRQLCHGVANVRRGGRA